MSDFKLNKHGFYVLPNPLRFRTRDEVNAYQEGKVHPIDLPKPGTQEYEDAPFEQGFILSPHVFTSEPKK